MSDVTTEASGSGGSAALDDVAQTARTVQDDEMEVSAIDALTDVKLSEDKALSEANTQLHRAKNQIGNQ